MERHEIHVHLHLDGCGVASAPFHEILAILRRIERMSGTISQQVDAATTAITSALDQLQADVSTVTTEIQTLVGELTPGQQVTQEQVDRLTALGQRATDIDNALKAAIAAGQPTT